MNNNYLISEKCIKQEIKDRFVAEKCLEQFFNNRYTYTITGTELTCPVDLKGTVSTKNKSLDFQIEVKERYKNQEQLLKYPNVELRVDKYKRMLTESPSGTSLLYMVLLNESDCYLFNLKKMDWNKVTQFDWWIKKTQVDPNSPYVCYPTYSIPKELALWKCDCSKYFQEWN